MGVPGPVVEGTLFFIQLSVLACVGAGVLFCTKRLDKDNTK